MTSCPRCHEPQPEATKFCMSCGARLSYEARKVSEAAFAPTVASIGPTPTPQPPVQPTLPPAHTPAPAARVPTPVPPGATPPLGSGPAGGPGAASPTPRPPSPFDAPLASTPAPSASPSTASEDRSIVVVTAHGRLVGLRAETGEVVWEHAIEPGTPQLAIAGGLVLAAVAQSLYCCVYRSGRPLWRAALSTLSSRVSMVVEEDRVYAFGDGVVDCFDRNGRRLWTRTVVQGVKASGAIGLPGNVAQADRE